MKCIATEFAKQMHSMNRHGGGCVAVSNPTRKHHGTASKNHADAEYRRIVFFLSLPFVEDTKLMFGITHNNNAREW